MYKLYPTESSILEKQIEEVQFNSLDQLAWRLTSPDGEMDASILESLLLCLPCFSSALDFVAAMKHSFDNAEKDPHREELRCDTSCSKPQFFRQFKVEPR